MHAFQSVGIACFFGLFFVSSAFATTRYVAMSNATPVAPYTNWATAATHISQAISEAASGDEILVAPGVYSLTGSAVFIPSSKTLTLRSVQNRGAIIDGQGLSQGLKIEGTNSLVEGFTIRNGVLEGFGSGGGVEVANQSTLRDCWVVSNRAYSGGGVYIAGTSVVENCIIENNLAAEAGGGASFSMTPGLIRNCIIRDNIASNKGGGVFFSYAGTVSNCWISGNRAVLADGGGARLEIGGELVNSVVVSNYAAQNGGGVNSSGPGETNPAPVINCTIIFNTAGASGGGVYAGYATRLVNDIIFHNTAATESNIYPWGSFCIFSNCCVTPSPGGSNFTNAPTFVNATAMDFHLATASACIDTGTTNYAPTTDLEGNPRPVVGTPGGAALVDVGAFEYAFHFNGIRFTSTNTVQLVWDEQDRGVYRVQATNNMVPVVWTDWASYTNPGMAAGQFLVHTQTLVIPPPEPSHTVILRLCIGHTPDPGR